MIIFLSVLALISCIGFACFSVLTSHSNNKFEGKIAYKLEALTTDREVLEEHGKAHVLVMDLGGTLRVRDALQRTSQMKSIYSRAEEYRANAMAKNVVSINHKIDGDNTTKLRSVK